MTIHQARFQGGDDVFQQAQLVESENRQLAQKWGGYLQHLNPEHEGYQQRANSLARMFENTNTNIGWMLNQVIDTTFLGGSLTEDATTSSAVASFANTIFPLLMRVFPNMIANDLVSIQPLNGPNGNVYYYDTLYGKDKGSIEKGDTVMGDKFSDTYTSQIIENEVLALGDGSAYGGAGAALDVQLNYYPVLPKGADRAGEIQVTMEEFNPVTSLVIQTAVDDGSGSFTGDSSAGSIDYAAGVVSAFKFTNAPANGNYIRVSYEYNTEGNEAVPTVEFKVTSKFLEARNRELLAKWTLQSQQDLRAQYGADGEQELVSDTTNLISLEIDRHILKKIHLQAQFSSVWNYATPGTGVSQLDHFRTILTEIDKLGAEINKGSKRGPANWMVVSPKVAAIFKQFTTHGDFIPAAPTTVAPVSWGLRKSQFEISKVGRVSNRITMYEDAFSTTDREILLGLKGDGYLSAGFVYAPYIPLYMTNTFEDPNSGTRSKRFMTRDAMAMLRPEYYAKLTVVGI